MTHSVKQISDRFGVGEHTVLAWIKSGELNAVNVGRQAGGKPKWRITTEALAAFELIRSAQPELPRPPRRRKPAAEGVVSFY